MRGLRLALDSTGHKPAVWALSAGSRHAGARSFRPGDQRGTVGRQKLSFGRPGKALQID
jgi:hypothetical protein